MKTCSGTAGNQKLIFPHQYFNMQFTMPFSQMINHKFQIHSRECIQNETSKRRNVLFICTHRRNKNDTTQNKTKQKTKPKQSRTKCSSNSLPTCLRPSGLGLFVTDTRSESEHQSGNVSSIFIRMLHFVFIPRIHPGRSPIPCA